MPTYQYNDTVVNFPLLHEELLDTFADDYDYVTATGDDVTVVMIDGYTDKSAVDTLISNHDPEERSTTQAEREELTTLLSTDTVKTTLLDLIDYRDNTLLVDYGALATDITDIDVELASIAQNISDINDDIAVAVAEPVAGDYTSELRRVELLCLRATKKALQANQANLQQIKANAGYTRRTIQGARKIYNDMLYVLRALREMWTG